MLAEFLTSIKINTQDEHVLYIFKILKITFCYVMCNEKMKIQETPTCSDRRFWTSLWASVSEFRKW